MATETITHYICDRCGRRSEKPDFKDGNRAGKISIKIEGHKSIKGHDGAWGGSRVRKDVEVCYSCSELLEKLFMDFMEEKEGSP